MATFLETPRFPDEVAFWAQGGARYNTIVTTSSSGREKRNSLWSYSLGAWRIQNVLRTVSVPQQYNIATIRNFFRAMKGQAYGFRFRDWTDYQDEGNGILGQPFSSFANSNFIPSSAGTGLSTYQMYKVYSETPFFDYRVVQKPYNGGGLLFYRNGVLLTLGINPGQIAVDTTTGIITFVADASSSVTGFTAGATTVINLAAAVTGLAVGMLVYLSLSGGGTVVPFLTGQAWQVTNISGSNITIAANTTGLTGPVGGNALKYAQSTETLTWTGMFDTPCRFNNDTFDAAFDTAGAVNLNLEVVEIRV